MVIRLFRFQMLRRDGFFERGVEHGDEKKQSDQEQHHRRIALVAIVDRAGDNRTRGRPPEIEGVVLERVPPTLVRHDGLWSVAHCESESPRARRSAAASPRQALPCMHASVVGPAAASLSIIARPSFVCE